MPLIEALRKVARAARKLTYADTPPMRIPATDEAWFETDKALDALPDWLTDE